MAKPKLRLWECPNDKHPAVRGPSKPRRDDVRRYCLKCSEESGRLVERTCPSLEREREAASAKTAEKRAVKLARAREVEGRRYTVACINGAGEKEWVDVREEVRRAINLKALHRPSGRKLKMPEIVVHRRIGGANAKRYEDSLYFSVYTGMSAEWLREAVVHEVAHLVAPREYGYRKRKRIVLSHGEKYRRVLVEALNERFPGVVCGSIKNQTAYEIDARVCKQLREQAVERSERAVAA